jgi:hypothetical protein
MYTVRSRTGKLMARFPTKREAQIYASRLGSTRRRARSPGDQTEFMFGGEVRDVLGNVRPKGHVYPNGDWNCPFCGAAVMTPADERYRPCGACDKVHCQNPGCHANPHYPVERAREDVRRAEARKAEEREREETSRWREQHAAEQRKERETRQNEIIQEAKKRGACVRHALLNFPYQPPKFVKHRGPCPLERGAKSPATVAAIHAAARRSGVKIGHRATLRPHRSGARTLAQRAYTAVDRGLSHAARWIAGSPRDELHAMTMLLVRRGVKEPAAKAWSLQQRGVGLSELEFRLQTGERLSPKRHRSR